MSLRFVTAGKNPASTRRYVVAVLALAFVARLGVMVALEGWKFESDRFYGWEEGEIAFALADGQGFSWPATGRAVGPRGQMEIRDDPEPTSWKAPIQPLIIAAAFVLFGPYSDQAAIAIELFQIGLSMLTCYFLIRLGRRLYNDWVGLLAAAIFALYPASIHFSVQKVEYAPLLTFLGVVLIDRTLALSDRPSIGGAASVGVISGLALLVNPVILVFYPFGLVWFVATGGRMWTKRLAHGTAILACCAAVLTPWVVRNYIVFDKLVFIRSNFSRELALGTYALDVGALARENDELFQDDTQPFAGDEAEVNEFFTQTAIKFLTERPFEFVRATVRRAATFWTHLGGASGVEALAVGAAYYSMLLLGIAGAWRSRKMRAAQLLLIYCLTMPIPFYLTWPNLGRFRFPIEPILILLASAAALAVASRWIPQLKETATRSRSGLM